MAIKFTHTVPPVSDAEEARIQAGIVQDADNPEWTDDELRKAKPFAEVFPELAAEIRKNVGGRPKSDNPKLSVSIRLDRDVVDAFKAGGDGWQSRMNDALRKSVGI